MSQLDSEPHFSGSNDDSGISASPNLITDSLKGSVIIIFLLDSRY